jgi:hypothetical protein
MEVTLTEEEATELRQLLDETISDMSMEIADTDNPQYRATLRGRRERLAAIRAKVDGASG